MTEISSVAGSARAIETARSISYRCVLHRLILMLLSLRRILALGISAAYVAACSTPPPTAAVPKAHVSQRVGTYKVGTPYESEGIWYYPREQPDYDETGVASWYGPTFHGKYTANGEIFDSGALTAAHRTLPMPVNVRVTNLENGRSLILRVNDRGPFARGRIIDVSARAAQLLGFYQTGTAKVRVTFVSQADLPGGAPPPSDTPLEIATAVSAAPTDTVQTASLAPVRGAPVSPPPRRVAPLPVPVASSALTPAADQPTGQVTEVPVPPSTHLYVQAGAFGQRQNAERLKTRLASAGGLFISPIDRHGQRLYRVRIGPFDAVDAADAALSRLVGLGGTDARIVVDQ
jgi:rare lipoprotein A